MQYEDLCHELKEEIARLKAEKAKLVEALWANIDYEPCRYDHYGYCQTHNLDNPCKVAEARALVAKHRGEG